MKQTSSRILGIDPGTNILGFAVIEVDGDKVDVLEIGVLHLKDKGEHVDKLKEIFLEIQEIIERYLPKDLAIEAPFFGKNVQSMLKLGRAQGVAMAAGMTMGLSIRVLSEESKAICHRKRKRFEGTSCRYDVPSAQPETRQVAA